MSSFLDAAAYLLVLGGSALAFVNARIAFRTALNTKVFLAFVHKQAEAEDPERIRKVIAMAPEAELMELTRRWLDLELPPVVHERSARGYREPAPVVSLEERTRDALAPYVEERRAWLRARLPRSAVGAGLLLAGVVLGVEREWIPTLSIIGGLFALFGGVGVWRLRRDLLVALETLASLPRPAEKSDLDEEPVTHEAHSSPAKPTRLVLRSPRAGLRRIPLLPGVIKIGRLPSAQLQLDGDRVSRLHAVIEVNADEVVLIDLGSTDGTRVNGKPITRHVLERHDRVTIGEHELVVA